MACTSGGNAQKGAGAARIGRVERWVCLAAGGALAVYGLDAVRRFMGGVGVAAAGGYLVYRGLSGRCPLTGAARERLADLWPCAADETAADGTREKDRVQTASEMSFPASDPPG